MSFAVSRIQSYGRWAVGLVAVAALLWSGCTLKFPAEWLEGECGDGIRQEGEQCDDGNSLSGDGCDENCDIESDWCGDGEIQTASGENCDDGDTTALDGCSDVCVVEPGWTCNGVPSVCVEECGDGSVVGDEATQTGCDDGNLTGGDGCSILCEVEPGYICVGEPSECQTGCGDGAVGGIEVCDDGNLVLGDGCDAQCQPELGFNCDGGSPTICTAICGDASVLGAEAEEGGCDDGNTDPDDGCAPDCTEEPGYDCTGQPSICTPVCGDNLTVGGEGCDDGNTDDCDGCRGDCSALETGCGDGFICGTEACDDGNPDWSDGCGGTCIVEAGWTCGGEPSQCTLGCTQPEALFLQAGCPGEMCVVTGYVGGTYQCEPEGSNPFYGSCSTFDSCVAGAACANVNSGLTCYPYCDLSDPTWVCPDDGAEIAACLFPYPQGSTTAGVCFANQCDAVAQTGCTGTWCDRLDEGVSMCSPDPPGTVVLHGTCDQQSTLPADNCLPGMLCIDTGSGDECLSLCRYTENDCTVGTESCFPWSANDPVYGVCQ